jgi:hypothetical protein
MLTPSPTPTRWWPTWRACWGRWGGWGRRWRRTTRWDRGVNPGVKSGVNSGGESELAVQQPSYTICIHTTKTTLHISSHHTLHPIIYRHAAVPRPRRPRPRRGRRAGGGGEGGQRAVPGACVCVSGRVALLSHTSRYAHFCAMLPVSTLCPPSFLPLPPLTPTNHSFAQNRF